MKSPLRITIDNASSIPIYKQIASNIEVLILDGEMEMGHFLPSERALADQLNVARGTVKKAYEELSNRGLVSASVGKGTKVEVSTIASGMGLKTLDELLISLVDEGYGKEEIKAVVKGRLKQEKSKIAVIDCNEEVLCIFSKQLSRFPVETTHFLLDDVLKFQSPIQAFSSYELIITTSNHYKEIVSLLEPCSEKIIKVAVGPDRETVMAMTLLENAINSNISSVGLIAKSERFAEILRNNISSFSLDIPTSQQVIGDDLVTLKDFLKNKEAVIMPPFYTLNLHQKALKELYSFKKNGGMILVFNYKVEKGSLLHIEEKLMVLNDKVEQVGG